MLTPPPRLGEELWARVRRHWRKGEVVTINRKTLQLALLRPMPEQPLIKEVRVGWGYVATDHELRRERPTDGLATEWRAADDEATDALLAGPVFAAGQAFPLGAAPDWCSGPGRATVPPSCSHDGPSV